MTTRTTTPTTTSSRSSQSSFAETDSAYGRSALLIVNLVVVAPFVWAAATAFLSPERYASSLQEDGTVEWTTVWSFLGAMACFLLLAHRQRRAARTVPWFSLCLAAFCLFVAMEEISWGQRLLGYRPPDYFLEQNYQQELNLHNLLATSWRKLALKAVILGYGVVLPLLCRIEPVRSLLQRIAVKSPPLGLAPGFLAAYLVYEIYPWKFTGELVELALGLAFLFSAIGLLGRQVLGRQGGSSGLRRVLPVAIGFGLLLLGSTTASATLRLRRAHPGNLEAARTEVAALRRDFLDLGAKKAVSECGQHKRLYTLVRKADLRELEPGFFMSLTAQGLSEVRSHYFIDPWNSPYWVRHKCSAGRVRVTIYSFGPNRRRDSDAHRIGGDDIAAIIESGG